MTNSQSPDLWDLFTGIVLCGMAVFFPSKAESHDSSGIVVGPKGWIYYVAAPGGTISRVRPDGTVLPAFTPRLHRNRAPDAHKLAIDIDGNLYLTGFGGLWKISPKQELTVVVPFANSFKVSVQSPTENVSQSQKKEYVRLYWNTALAVDKTGAIYCVNVNIDRRLSRILRFEENGSGRIIAGSNWGHKDGRGAEAQFLPMINSAMAIGPDNALYLTDGGKPQTPLGTCIRRVTADGNVETIAGSIEPGFTDGPASSARFGNVTGIAIARDGDIFVADAGNKRIRKVTPAGAVTTMAGNGQAVTVDGQGIEAAFSNPTGIALDRKGNIFVLDDESIRGISPDLQVTTIRGPPKEKEN